MKINMREIIKLLLIIHVILLSGCGDDENKSEDKSESESVIPYNEGSKKISDVNFDGSNHLFLATNGLIIDRDIDTGNEEIIFDAGTFHEYSPSDFVISSINSTDSYVYFILGIKQNVNSRPSGKYIYQYDRNSKAMRLLASPNAEENTPYFDSITINEAGDTLYSIHIEHEWPAEYTNINKIDIETGNKELLASFQIAPPYGDNEKELYQIAMDEKNNRIIGFGTDDENDIIIYTFDISGESNKFEQLSHCPIGVESYSITFSPLNNTLYAVIYDENDLFNIKNPALYEIVPETCSLTLLVDATDIIDHHWYYNNKGIDFNFQTRDLYLSHFNYNLDTRKFSFRK
ncbi:hypothetical protein [Photobacterium indicum]|uniref:hypothetical protein n=1 Tax=Photobacterium indicum TaxID=81447 RepID=UPI003D0D98BA